jgi:hypothetical protein
MGRKATGKVHQSRQPVTGVANQFAPKKLGVPYAVVCVRAFGNELLMIHG